MSQLSTGLPRDERRRGGGGIIIHTLAEAAQISRVSLRTFERLISIGEGPPILKLSPRRRGVSDPALCAWLKSRSCKLTVAANVGAGAESSTSPT
jgi:hypothetical protein